MVFSPAADPAATRPTARHERATFRRTVVVGLVVFIAGLAFVMADVVPFFAGDRNRSLWLNACCMLAPLGFAIVVGTVLRRGHREQRAIAAAADRETIAGTETS